MILAVYTKNKPKDKWLLYSVAPSMELAKTHSKEAMRIAKIIGYENPDSVIQGYESPSSIPKILEKITPEKLLYN